MTSRSWLKFNSRGFHSRKSAGFTLVELLVVITIIGMLMSLLMPGVQAAVEAARNAACKSNLNNLATAVVGFESTNQKYPGYNNKLGTRTSPVSWVVTVLANLGRENEYKLWAASNTTPTLNYMEMFVCPSNPPETTSGAINAYVANAGLATGTEKAANGIFFDRFNNGPAMSQDGVVDGVDRTVMLSENIQASNGGTSAGWDKAGKLANVFLWYGLTGSPTGDYKINANKTTTTLSTTSARPSSYHPGGVNAAFCGRNVVFLREDMEYRVYQQIMTSDGANSDMPLDKTKPLNDSDFK